MAKYINDTGKPIEDAAKRRFAEAANNVRPLQYGPLEEANKKLQSINSEIDGSRIEKVDGGHVINGMFVPTKGSDYETAFTNASKYYESRYGDEPYDTRKKKYYKDLFYWYNPKIKEYELQAVKKSGRTYGKQRPDTDYHALDANELSKLSDYDTLITNKAEAEAEVARQQAAANAIRQAEVSQASEPKDVALEQDTTNENAVANQSEEEITAEVDVPAVYETAAEEVANSPATTEVATPPAATRESNTTVKTVSTNPATTAATNQDNTTTKGVTNTTTPVTPSTTDSPFSNLFSEARKKVKQEKTNAAKMQQYYALTDALKVLGDMGGAVIGGAIGGDAVGGVSTTGDFKPSRGYIEAFEKAKAADKILRELDQKEYEATLSYEKKKEEREYKEQQAAILQQYKLDIEKLRQEYKTASEERKAQIRQEEINAKYAAQEKLARLKADLEYEHDLSLIDERALAEMDLIDHRADAYGDSSYGSKSSEKTEPVMFHDNTTMEIPKRYYDSMKRDFVGNDWNGRKVTKDNVDLYIKNNPDVVKAYLESFGVTTEASSSRRVGTPSSSTPKSSSSSGTPSSSRVESVDDLLNAL